MSVSLSSWRPPPCKADPPAGLPPTGLNPPPWWQRDGWLGRSAFTLTKRTCFSAQWARSLWVPSRGRLVDWSSKSVKQSLTTMSLHKSCTQTPKLRYETVQVFTRVLASSLSIWYLSKRVWLNTKIVTEYFFKGSLRTALAICQCWSCLFFGPFSSEGSLRYSWQCSCFKRSYCCYWPLWDKPSEKGW